MRARACVCVWGRGGGGERLEDGEGGDGVCGGEERAEDDRVEEAAPIIRIIHTCII